MLLDNRRLLPLLALLQLLLIPALWPQLQLWVVAVSLLTLGLRAMMLWRGWRPPRSAQLPARRRGRRARPDRAPRRANGRTSPRH